MDHKYYHIYDNVGRTPGASTYKRPPTRSLSKIKDTLGSGLLSLIQNVERLSFGGRLKNIKSIQLVP